MLAYSSKPVKIPEVAGKISFMKKTDRTYVRYEFGRTYNPVKKSTIPQRAIIGLQIRNAPTLMLPNENYEKYFGKDGDEKMTAKERMTAENFEAMSNDFWMLNCMFEQLYFEFQIQAHRNPKPYGAFLEIPPEPVEVPDNEPLITTALDPADGSPEEQRLRSGKTKLVGLDYSDIALLLTQYKGAMTRFAGDCL